MQIEYPVDNPNYRKRFYLMLGILILLLCVGVVISFGVKLSWYNLPIFIPAFIPLFINPISVIINRDKQRLDRKYLWGTKTGKSFSYFEKAELQSNSKRSVKLTTTMGGVFYINVFDGESFCRDFNASL